MFSLARITLPNPVTLTLPAFRSRIIPGVGAAPSQGVPRTFTGFDTCFLINPVTRTIHAQMPPLPRALLIYGVVLMIPLFVFTRIGLVLGQVDLGLWLLAPLIVPSIYASYRDIFVHTPPAA